MQTTPKTRTPRKGTRSSKEPLVRSAKTTRRGVCRFCGCTENSACILGYEGGHSSLDNFDSKLPITCCWWTADQTVCNKAHCVEGYEAEQILGKVNQQANQALANLQRARGVASVNKEDDLVIGLSDLCSRIDRLIVDTASLRGVLQSRIEGEQGSETA